MVAVQQHRAGDAIKFASTALELDPGFVFAHVRLGMAYELQGQYDAAIGEFVKAVPPLREVAPGWEGLLAHALARVGRREEAEGILADLHQCAGRRYVDSLLLAVAHAGLGQTEEAIECLEHAELCSWTFCTLPHEFSSFKRQGAANGLRL